MGFMGGEQRHSNDNLVQDGGGQALNLDQPLSRFPYDRVTVLGLRYDIRLVVSYVRMTAGFDLPYAAYQADQTTQRYDIDGVDRDVSARSLRMKALRFGIGAELPLSPITPFVDLLGSIEWVDTRLAVDQETRDFQATTFGFAVRGGVRLQVRRWFFASVAGEVGLSSNVLWGAELAVGFSTW
jgi:hypothetical protein